MYSLISWRTHKPAQLLQLNVNIVGLMTIYRDVVYPAQKLFINAIASAISTNKLSKHVYILILD